MVHRWHHCRASRRLALHTVRGAAEDLGVYCDATFRWRHRFVALPRLDHAPLLHGIAETDGR